jgi:hypothetical protein
LNNGFIFQMKVYIPLAMKCFGSFLFSNCLHLFDWMYQWSEWIKKEMYHLYSLFCENSLRIKGYSIDSIVYLQWLEHGKKEFGSIICKDRVER